MPIYQYECKCGKKFDIYGTYEFFRNYEPICSCGSKDVKKIISSPPAIIFRGSGFYSTDNN